MLEAVLLDVGGTIWPDHLAPAMGGDPRLQQLSELLPSVEPARALAVLGRRLRLAAEPLVHDVAGAVRAALDELEFDAGLVEARAVARALYEPAAQRMQLFPGTRELLLAQRQLRLRCVVLSNTTFRGTAEYWQDFRDFGVAELLDGVITSMDVGYRKPHPAIFEAAIAEAGCEPNACVMVGNSEQNDVEPAVALGMCAIRVAIEEPRPARSAAHAVASSLEEVIAILRRWAEGERCPPAKGGTRTLRACARG